METYIVVHESQYGVELFRISTDEEFFVNRSIESDNVQQQIADHLRLDYNPLKDSLTVYSDQSITEMGTPLVLDMEF